MKNTLALFAFASLSAITLTASVSKAMPLAQPAQSNAIERAFAATPCNDKSDCQSSYGATRVEWDESREHGGRYGYRNRDEEYEHHPRYRDRDEYEQRGEYRGHGRYGRNRDEYEERGEYGGHGRYGRNMEKGYEERGEYGGHGRYGGNWEKD